MNIDKVCIIYWGLIRGFKYDYTFNTHKEKIYDKLKEKNIEFDIYMVTNNIDYDDTNIKKIPNLKLLKIINISEIHNSEEYKKVYNNIKFTTPGWNDYFQTNLITLFNNKQQILEIIPKDYKKYLSMDIAHIVKEFDINLFNINNNFTSSFESSLGFNPRVLLGDYKSIEIEYSRFNYILNSSKISVHNPEILLKNIFTENNIIIKTTPLIKIIRIRSNGKTA